MDILNKIKEMLLAQHKSQKELCDFLGINKQAFSGWNRGQTESYKKYLPQIAEFLGCSVDYLLGRDQKKEAVLSDDPNEKKKDEIRRLFDQMTPEQQEAFLLEGYRVVFGQDISKDDLKKPVKHGSIDNQDEDNN